MNGCRGELAPSVYSIQANLSRRYRETVGQWKAIPDRVAVKPGRKRQQQMISLPLPLPAPAGQFARDSERFTSSLPSPFGVKGNGLSHTESRATAAQEQQSSSGYNSGSYVDDVVEIMDDVSEPNSTPNSAPSHRMQARSPYFQRPSPAALALMAMPAATARGMQPTMIDAGSYRL